MFKSLFASGDLNIFPMTGLFIFFSMMTIVYLWVMRKGRGRFYSELSAQALDLPVTDAVEKKVSTKVGPGSTREEA